MEDKKLQNGIEEIRRIKMTASEKMQICESVLNSTISPKEGPIRSTWFNYSFISRIKKTHLAYYVIIPLIIILTGGGIAAASEDSLPNSILYPIKVSVVEPVMGALTFSPKARAKYEASLANTRMVEAETLASKGKLDQTTEKKLNTLLDSHTIALNKALDKVGKTESSDQVDEIVTNFHAGMNAHARVLDIINNKTKEKTAGVMSATVISPDTNTDTNNQDGVGQDLGTQISNTARNNADGIKSVAKNKEIKNNNRKENNPTLYQQKKASVEALINTMTTNLDNTNNEVGNSSVEQSIIDDTHKTLNEAKQYLDEATQKETEGDGSDAYSSLLDSESSAKEANIFLNTGMDLKTGNLGEGNIDNNTDN